MNEACYGILRICSQNANPIFKHGHENVFVDHYTDISACNILLCRKYALCRVMYDIAFGVHSNLVSNLCGLKKV